MHSLKYSSYCSSLSAANEHPSSCYSSSFAHHSFAWLLLCVLSAVFSMRWLLSPHLRSTQVFFHTDGVCGCIGMSSAAVAPLWLVISFVVLWENNCNNNMHLKRIWVSLCELSADLAACWSYVQYYSNNLPFDSLGMVTTCGSSKVSMQTFDIRCHLNAWTTCCAAAEESRANKQREGKIQAVTVFTGEASLNNTISASLGLCKPTLNWPQKLRNFEQTSEGESRCSFTRL